MVIFFFLLFVVCGHHFTSCHVLINVVNVYKQFRENQMWKKVKITKNMYSKFDFNFNNNTNWPLGIETSVPKEQYCSEVVTDLD